MLSDSRFWSISAATIVLGLTALLWNGQLRWQKAACVVAASFALVSLPFSAQNLVLRLIPARDGSGGYADSTLALGLFTLVATLAGAYAFYVVARFSRQRKSLAASVKQATRSSRMAKSELSTLRKQVAEWSDQLNLTQLRFQAFLSVQSDLKDVDIEGSAEAFRRFCDLKLLEAVLLRDRWDVLALDLRECLHCLTHDGGDLRSDAQPVLRYVRQLIESKVVFADGGPEGSSVVGVFADIGAMYPGTRLGNMEPSKG